MWRLLDHRQQEIFLENPARRCSQGLPKCDEEALERLSGDAPVGNAPVNVEPTLDLQDGAQVVATAGELTQGSVGIAGVVELDSGLLRISLDLDLGVERDAGTGVGNAENLFHEFTPRLVFRTKQQ